MAPLVADLGEESELLGVAGVYLVGGGSGLPLVSRRLRERFGRRVHRSPYPSASTAIGLAIAADAESDYVLTDRLSRGFGVFREWDGGQAVAFDQLVHRDQVLSREGLEVVRRYRPVHNIGWFRFVEYTTVDADGQPTGHLAPFGDVLFGYDPDLQGRGDLSSIPVERVGEGHLIEERYRVDGNGIIEVTLVDLESGYRQHHALRA